MVGGFEGRYVHLPATSDVQLLVYLKGGAVLLDGDGNEHRMAAAFIAGPMFGPRMYRVEPDSRFVAITFRPTGFSACLGLPVNAFTDRLVSLESVLGAGAATALAEQLDCSSSLQSIAAVLDAFLLQRLLQGQGKLPVLPRLPLAHILQPAGKLADQLALSPRQLERHFLTLYGMPLRDYRRLARFSVALAGLMQGGTRPPKLSHIALDACYVDQAHFTKDFRQFVGDTPGGYIKSRQQAGSIYHLWQMNDDELPTYLE